MRSIRSKDTSLEMKIRRALHARGFRYRLHRRDLPGSPDLVFPGRRKVVFIHGCFWHQHPSPGCPISHRPKSNIDYWDPKLNRTLHRDGENRDHLHSLGWEVFTVWECEAQNIQKVEAELMRFLRDS